MTNQLTEVRVLDLPQPLKVYRICQVCHKQVETEKEQYACSEECGDVVQAYLEKDLV